MWSLFISFCLGFIFCKALPSLRHRAFARFMSYFYSTVDPSFVAFKKKIFGDIVKEKPRRPGSSELRILEVGVGTGTNFQFYPDGCHLVVVDPNPYFESYYNANKAKFPNIKTQEFIVAKGEDMTMVEDNSVDVVVVSLVLCSVGDCKKFLQQVLRVLVPGGKLYFMEHIREWDSDKHSMKQRFQDCLTWLQVWPALFDGCELNRETHEEQLFNLKTK
ncbi:thiol S-methyltransferase METTL7B [Hyalella azteca]|uniref:Thiol S-methyltransferase METTL7B n=1 Tax=Hyalella azteca TaxID=294128 RepID=A0A979FXP2_HYAAZ|nr:thiol S-methyltransferase METTL7B [Hyalella azteca]